MADPRVQGIVEFILKEKGLLDAGIRLRELEAQVKQTQGSFGGLGAAGKELGSVLRTYIAPLAIFNFFRTSALDMLEFQKRLAGTAQTIRSLGGDASKEMPRVQAFLGAIQDATGIIDDETLPAFQKLLGITESVPAALEGVALAARVARSGAMEFSEAAQAITDVLAGKLSEAAKKLNVGLVDASGSARNAADVFDELGQRLDKLDLEKQATGVKGLAGAWDNFSDAVGTVFIPVMNAASRIVQAFLNVGTLLFKIIEGGAIAFANLSLQIANVATGLYGLVTGKGLEGFSKFNDATEQLHQQLLDLLYGAEEVDKGLANTTKGLEDAAKRIRGLDDGKDIKDRLAAEKALLDSKIALAEEGSRKRLDLELQALEVERAAKVKAAGKDLDQIAAIYETYDNKRRKLETEYTQFQSEESRKRAAEAEKLNAQLMAGLRAMMSEAKKLMSEMGSGDEKLEKFFQDFAEQSAEAFMQRLEANRAAQDALLEEELAYRKQSFEFATEGEWFLSEEKVSIAQQTLQAIEDAEIEAINRKYQREIAASEAIGADTAAIRARWEKEVERTTRTYQQEMVRLEKMSTLQKGQYWGQYAAQAVGAMQGIFGQSKGLAIAEAIVDTANAIMQTYATYGMTPWGHAMAVAMGMVGLMNIQKIRSTNFNSGGGGKGFDDAMSDREARFGGQRWARDFVRETESGFRIGLQEAGLSRRLASAAQSVTNNNSIVNDQSTGQVIHVHGAYIDSDSLRGLSRRLREVERDDQARFQR